MLWWTYDTFDIQTYDILESSNIYLNTVYIFLYVVIGNFDVRESMSAEGLEIDGRDRKIVKLHGARDPRRKCISAKYATSYNYLFSTRRARGEKRFLKEIDGSTNARRETDTRGVQQGAHMYIYCIYKYMHKSVYVYVVYVDERAMAGY